MAPVAPDPSNALRTIAALRDEHFDVVHLHEPLAPGCTVTTLVCSNAPMVGTFHAAGTSASYRWLAPFLRPLAARLTIRCAVSEDARDLAQGGLGGEYVLLHNGIDVERFAKATPWPTEGPTVLFLSRHEERKGLDVLIDALPALPAHARVWVASDGPDTARLKAAAAGDDRVEWLGRIDEGEKIRRLRGAEVLCAPSLRGESFGMILLEAMAAETPIVASDLPGLPQRHRRGRARPPSWCRPATPPPWAPPCAGCSRSRRWPRRWRRPATSGPPPSPWTGWPSATSSSTARRSQGSLPYDGAGHGPDHRDRRCRPARCCT